MGKVAKKTDDKIQEKKNPPRGKGINKSSKTASPLVKKEKKTNLVKAVKKTKIARNSETNSHQGHKLNAGKKKNNETEMANEEENNNVHALSDNDSAEEDDQMTLDSDTEACSDYESEEDPDYEAETEVEDDDDDDEDDDDYDEDNGEEEKEENDAVDDSNNDDDGEPKKKRCKKSFIKKTAPKNLPGSKSNYAYDEPQIESKIDMIDMPRKKQVKIFDQNKWTVAKAVKTVDMDVEKWLETHSARESYFFGEDEVRRNVYNLDTAKEKWDCINLNW